LITAGLLNPAVGRAMLYANFKEKARRYNLSEMSIVLGLAAVYFLLFAGLLGLVLHEVFNVANKTAVIAGMIVWSGCVLWLWIAFVRIGRESPTLKISTGELSILQIVFTALFGVSAVFSKPGGDLGSEVLASFFATLLLLFQIIYFTLGGELEREFHFAPMPCSRS
jgi:hypothetical protein